HGREPLVALEAVEDRRDLPGAVDGRVDPGQEGVLVQSPPRVADVADRLADGPHLPQAWRRRSSRGSVSRPYSSGRRSRYMVCLVRTSAMRSRSMVAAATWSGSPSP